MRRLLCLFGIHNFRMYYDGGWLRCTRCGAVRKVERFIVRE